MKNKEAIEILLEKWDTEWEVLGVDFYDAMMLSIDALEEAQLDIDALRDDHPELFKPRCDGGYLKEGEEEDNG